MASLTLTKAGRLQQRIRAVPPSHVSPSAFSCWSPRPRLHMRDLLLGIGGWRVSAASPQQRGSPAATHHPSVRPCVAK